MTPASPAGDDLEISPADTAAALADGSAVVVDVREPYELEEGYIEGTRHIALERLASQSNSLPKDGKVIFLCHSGVRSAMAAQAFRAAGIDAWSMAGGIVQWNEEGRPLVADGGKVADH